MAKILIWISVAITLGTGFLAFQTKNKVTAVNTELVTTRGDKTKLQADKAKLTGDLKKSTEELTAANKVVDDQKGQLAQAATDLTASKAETAKAMETTEEANKKYADLKAEFDKIPVPKPGVGGETLAPAQALADMQKQIDNLNAAVKEQTQIADTFKQQAHAQDDKVAQLTAQVKKYRDNVARPGITGRVMAVNQGWNFVVIDVGDRRGAAMSAPLIVTRGGQQIARLRITSVEPNSSIADVIPGSLPRGQSVQPGDTVIFAGRQPAPADQGAASPEVPAGGVGGGTAQVQ